MSDPVQYARQPIPELPPDATPEQHEQHWYEHVYQGDHVPQLTVRAVLMGAFIGMFMAMSNLYTTLKIGWAFGVAITACILSYVLWNGLRAMTGNRLTRMSILENNCMQSTASSAGYSTGSIIATAFGAMLLMDEEGRHTPWITLTLFTFGIAALGVFLAIPMKRQMINRERLPFPSGIAAAETLRSLYSQGAVAMQKAYSLIVALLVGIVVAILRAPDLMLSGITNLPKYLHGLRDLPGYAKIPATIPMPYPSGWLGGKQAAGYGLEPSTLLVGAGMIVGPRVSYSMLAASFILYFLVGPMLFQADVASAGVEGYVPSIVLVGGGQLCHFPRWSLWGGTALMVFSSLAALALQWETLARAFLMLGGAGRSATATDERAKRIEVPMSWLIVGMIPITLLLVALQYYAFQIAIWLGLIAVAMSFFIALVCSRATGETDTTPLGAMGKVTQVTYAVLAPGNAVTNLAAAGVTGGAGSASADLLTDLKSGYLLGANPRRQFLAQFFGIFFGTLAVVPAWYAMVPDKATLEAFNPPATLMWQAVAEALTTGLESIPPSARLAVVVCGLIGVMLPVLAHLLPRQAAFLPSAMGLGIGLVVPWVNSFSFAIGATFVLFWKLWHRRSADVFVIPIASGFVAGESVMMALLAIAVALPATLARLEGIWPF